MRRDAGTTIGSELRRWRELRALSQLALSSQADVSARHISFVETGRSRPTPDMILRLAEALRVPMVEQNRLLLTGGFAPRYSERDVRDDALAPVLAGLRALLDAHEPYPALLLDDHWSIVDSNRAVNALLEGVAPELLEPPINVIRLCLHPRGLAPRIMNLRAWSTHLLRQLDRRVAHTGGDEALLALQAEVIRYPGAVRDPGAAAASGPVVLMELEIIPGQRLSLFSVASRIEDAFDVTVDGLHLETFVPADDATRRFLASPASRA